ncbi:MAG TPA: hypothetical protein VMF29_08560 [Candidatus Edwardsbacteria bacterium]|nr:hypothetical protein [Candidatus Edwardsbacteria bacterium]
MPNRRPCGPARPGWAVSSPAGRLLCAAVLACWAAAGTASADLQDWQHFRSFGGRTALGTIRTLAADARYVYAFSASGGARYDKLRDQWDFDFPLQSPSFAADFTVLDPFENNIYFVAGQKLYPYHPISGIWYTAIEFPGAIRQLAFEAKSIAARTDRGIFLCDRWNSAVTPSARPEASFTWANGTDPQLVRNDPQLRFLLPSTMMDRWALLHPLTAVAFEPATEYIWAAYAGMGLWRYDRVSRQGLQVTKGFLASADVLALYGRGSQLGLAGQGGITMFDQRSGQWQQLDLLFNLDLATVAIRALAFDDQDLFVGTGGGVVAVAQGDDYARTITEFDGLPDERVNCLSLSGDSLWVGTDNGPALYLRGAKRAVNRWHQLSSVIVNAIAQDARSVYLATSRGAFIIDKADSMELRRYDDAAPIEVWWELRGVAADDSMVWWLAPDGLAGRNQRSGEWRFWSRTGQYAAGQSLALATDSQYVWVGSDAGLAQYDKRANAWRTYHQGDGLLDEAVLAVWSAGGYVWCGGRNGASRFHWQR